MAQRIIHASDTKPKELGKDVIAQLIPGSNEFGEAKGDGWKDPWKANEKSSNGAY